MTGARPRLARLLCLLENTPHPRFSFGSILPQILKGSKIYCSSSANASRTKLSGSLVALEYWARQCSPFMLTMQSAPPLESQNTTTDFPFPLGASMAISPSGVGYTSKRRGDISCIFLISCSAFAFAVSEGFGNPSSRASSVASRRSLRASTSSSLLTASSSPRASSEDLRPASAGCFLIAYNTTFHQETQESLNPHQENSADRHFARNLQGMSLRPNGDIPE